MIEMNRWGKDHWETFAYFEDLAVNHGGVIAPERGRMRCNIHEHPGLAYDRGFGPTDGSKYPTRLKDGELQGHDDWDCADDMVEAGLLEDIGTGIHPVYRLTEKGRIIANQLRDHKAHGGLYHKFEANLEALPKPELNSVQQKEPQPVEGWKYLIGSTKAHYFVDKRSLCGKWMAFNNDGLEQGNDHSSSNCKACIKALEQRKKGK